MSVSDPLPPAAPPPRSSTKTAAIAVVVVLITFVSGIAAGFLLAHLRREHPPRMMPRMIVNHLSRRLDLTAEQRKKVEEIVMRHHERIVKLQDSVRPQVRLEVEAANREIDAVLTPEQRQKFAKLRMQLGHHPSRR